MKKKIAMLFALSVLVLTSCVNGKPNDSSANSSNNESESQSESGSEGPIVSDAFNAYKCAQLAVSVANKYSEDVTLEGVLEQLKNCGEDIDLLQSSDALTNEVVATLVLYYAFKDILPERIGARSFQGMSFDVDKVTINNVKDNSKNGIVYKAMKALGEFGIYSTPRGGTISAGKAITEKKVKVYLNRIHSYFGESYADDFFATVNHDFLYDDNPYQHAPNDGRLSYDEVLDTDNLHNIYDSKLIPTTDIVDWMYEIKGDIPAVDNFIETYSNFEKRTAGNAAGLVAALNKYLVIDDIDDLIEALRTQVLEEGYCPLWDSAEVGHYTYTNGNKASLMNVVPFTYSADSPSSVAPGSTAYNDSVARFKPIFQEVIGCSDAQALTYAENYCTFKYKLAVNQARWSSPDGSDSYAFLTEDSEAPTTSGYYTNASFPSTGETLYHFFQTLGVENPGSVMFSSRMAIDSIIQIFTQENLEYVKGLFIWQMLNHFHICLPDAEHVNAWIYKPGYANNKATLVDNKELFYSYVCEYISGDISNYWTASQEFAGDAQAVVGVVNDIKDAMRSRADAATWLSADAKSKATLKTNNMRYCVGGLTSDGSTLTFPNLQFKDSTNGSLYENIGMAQKETWLVAAAEVGADWGTFDLKRLFSSYDPLTANAFYYPSLNAIYITLGYMSCYPNARSANELQLLSDYGWVVAHEISHGFDSSGIYYDDQGVYHKKGWFNTDDQNAYNARTKAVQNYYDGYEVMPGKETNGKTVLTEACADINGLHLVMEVAKGINDFDYRQFFINCADNFGDYASQYTYTSALASDEHPFGRARVNLAMMSIDEWHQTFETKEGDGMWIDPSERIAIW